MPLWAVEGPGFDDSAKNRHKEADGRPRWRRSCLCRGAIPSAREADGCGSRFTDTQCAVAKYKESPYLVEKMRLFAGSSRGSKLSRPTV